MTCFQTGSRLFLTVSDVHLRAVPSTEKVILGSDEPSPQRRALSLTASPVAWNSPIRSSLGSFPSGKASSSKGSNALASA